MLRGPRKPYIPNVEVQALGVAYRGYSAFQISNLSKFSRPCILFRGGGNLKLLRGSSVGVRILLSGLAVGFLCLSAWPAGLRAERSRSPARKAVASSPTKDVGHRFFEADPLVDPVPHRGQTARGLYFNGPMVRRLGAAGIIRSVKGAGLDAAVLDLKDGQGRVMFDTRIEVLQPQKRIFVSDFKAVIAQLRQAGIYTIGRIVSFNDPQLPVRHPERAVMDGRPRRQGRVWANNGRRNPWLDPYNGKNHDLLVEFAKEAEALGLDELQFDYFRFPVDAATAFAHFPAQVDTPRRYVLLGLLRRIDSAIRIPIGVDVFGLTAFRKGDKAGLGQSLEDWAQHLEVFSPMLYVNGMTAWGRDGQGQRAFRLVCAAITQLRRRLGHGPVIRPFLQAFPQGADYYTPEFIDEQIRGARVGGADGFLFWHPASNYGMVKRGMLGPARGASPFPLGERAWWRQQVWNDNQPARTRADARVPGARQSYLR